MVYDGRLYLYTSHDEDVTVNNFFTMNDWRLYSTGGHGELDGPRLTGGLQDLQLGNGRCVGPQGVARNGKFYSTCRSTTTRGAKIGVGVANSPAGPFTDPLGKGAGLDGSGNIDPTVFIDDDGQAYLYWGNPDLSGT